MPRQALVDPQPTNIMRKKRGNTMVKDLPTREWGTASTKPIQSYESMDKPDPRTQGCLDVAPKTRYYLDVEDNERERN